MASYGDYELVRRLAVGGMAEVFVALARDGQGNRRPVVLKRILPHLEDRAQFVRMFLDEARLTSQLTHPNVVQIYDFGRAEGVHYIAMEFVDGLSLRQLLGRVEGGLLPCTLGCFIVAEACAALAYAHDKADDQGQPLGIVHRDVSPDNILVSRTGMVKLADFGIAKATTQINRTMPGQIKGKLAYMSPEQAMQHPLIDRRSDVFSAGTVLYELACGRRLFDASNDAVVLRAIAFGDYPPPAERGGYPTWIGAILRKALDKDPQRRFQDAGLFRDALLRVIRSVAPTVDHRMQLAELVGIHSDQEITFDRLGRLTEVAQPGVGTALGLGPRPADTIKEMPAPFQTLKEMPAVGLSGEVTTTAVASGKDTLEEISAVTTPSLALDDTAPARALQGASSALTTAEAPKVSITPPDAAASPARRDTAGPPRRRAPSAPLPELVLDDGQLGASGSVSMVDDDDGPPPVTRRADLTHRVRWSSDFSRVELLQRWRLLVAGAVALLLLVVLLIALL